jgi:hypothetical protein
MWNMARLVGDYRYSGCVIAGIRYAVIRNGDTIERVRQITSAGNPIVWQIGDPMTEKIMAIITASDQISEPHFVSEFR